MHLSHYVHSKLLESNFCIKIGKIGSYSTSSEISRAFVSITMFQCQHTRSHYLSVRLNLVLFLNHSHYDMQVHLKLESAEKWRFWRFFVFVFFFIFLVLFSFFLSFFFFFFKEETKKLSNLRLCPCRRRKRDSFLKVQIYGHFMWHLHWKTVYGLLQEGVLAVTTGNLYFVAGKCCV